MSSVSSLLIFSAKTVGSLWPSSSMNSICFPRIPPAALISSAAEHQRVADRLLADGHRTRRRVQEAELDGVTFDADVTRCRFGVGGRLRSVGRFGAGRGIGRAGIVVAAGARHAGRATRAGARQFVGHFGSAWDSLGGGMCSRSAHRSSKRPPGERARTYERQIFGMCLECEVLAHPCRSALDRSGVPHAGQPGSRRTCPSRRDASTGCAHSTASARSPPIPTTTSIPRFHRNCEEGCGQRRRSLQVVSHARNGHGSLARCSAFWRERRSTRTSRAAVPTSLPG